MMKTTAEIIQELTEKFQDDTSILAFLVTGSYARQEAYPGDDLDLIILTKEKRKFEEYHEGETLVEIKSVPYPTVIETMSEKPMQVYMWLDAKPIFDRNQYVKELQEKAQQVLDTYQPTEQEKQLLAKWLRSARDKIIVAQKNKNEMKVGFNVSGILWKIVEGLYMINKRPVPASTTALRLISSLTLLPDDFQTIWRQTLLGTLDERTQSTLALITFLTGKLSDE